MSAAINSGSPTGQAAAFEEQADALRANAPSDEQMNEGLLKGLQSIQNHVEGRGGKVEPSAAT